MTQLPSIQDLISKREQRIKDSESPSLLQSRSKEGDMGEDGDSESEEKPTLPTGFKLSAEFHYLLVSFCATNRAAMELKDINWRPLAVELGTPLSSLEEIASMLAQNGKFWEDVLKERIKRAAGAKVFSDANWQTLRGKGLERLLFMMEKNLIRDVGELLAVISAAERFTGPAQGAGTPSTQVNITLGGETMNRDASLPPAGTTMTIDLSPRLASAIQGRQQKVDTVGGRVIDGEMISATELREALTERSKEKLEGESDE